MKLPSLLGLIGLRRDLRRIATALESIAEAQQRQANLLEGIEPARPSPPDAISPPAETLLQHPQHFERQEAVEQWFLAHHGRMPTPEELCREIDGLPWSADEAAEAIEAKWTRTRARAGQIQ